jgi:hypothetical protein
MGQLVRSHRRHHVVVARNTLLMLETQGFLDKLVSAHVDSVLRVTKVMADQSINTFPAKSTVRHVPTIYGWVNPGRISWVARNICLG